MYPYAYPYHSPYPRQGGEWVFMTWAEIMERKLKEAAEAGRRAYELALARQQRRDVWKKEGIPRPSYDFD